jgi:flavin-dependent dehydrogenase
MSKKNLHIVVVGGGTAGWMTANLLIKKWQVLGISVTVVESPNVATVGVGEGSTPTLKRFFETIDVPENQWMSKCNATYKLNIKFKGWSPKSAIPAYSHPFTSQVDVFTSRALHVNCRTRRLGLDTRTQPEDFLLNGVLASDNKSPVAPENFPFKVEYGYHFDSHLLGQFLSDHAVNQSVRHIRAHIEHVEQDTNGNITALIADDGIRINGDFFVDCSGFSSFLMEKTLGGKFKSFKENLFNDSAVVMQTPTENSAIKETTSTALSNGWCWNIPLQNRQGNGYVFSSDFVTKDQAEIEFRQHLGLLDSSTECRHLAMRVGQLDKHWIKNCIGIGLSQGFIEPLEATALHLVQISIEHFIYQFESGGFSNKNSHIYNQNISERFERVRDYIVAHYKLNTRDDSDYWRANRDNNALSDSLIKLLDVWYKCDDLSEEIIRQNLTTHFDTTSWHCLFAGYGIFPPLKPNQPGKGDLYLDQNIEKFLQGCSLNFSR